MKHLITLITLALFTPALASPVFDGGAADTWVHRADAPPQALRLGDRTVQAVAAVLGVQVSTVRGARVLLPVDPETTHVWVNAAAESWRPLAADAPALALAGLGDGMFGAPGALRAEASPPPGRYDQAVRVTLRAAGGDRPTVSYTLDGERVETRSAEVTVDLIGRGEHVLEYWAVDRAGRSDPVIGRWTIDTAPMHDSDGDGIPDVVEARFGGDVLSGRLGQDAAALADWLRDRRPGDTSDRDRDGWSAFDERLRGTDPEDPTSRPTARTLNGVEARVELTVADLERVDLRALDARWVPVKPRLADGGNAGRLEGLAANALPVLRLPVDAPLIVRAAQSERAAKVWIDAVASPTPGDVQGEFADADAWADAYEALLAERLVVARRVTLDGPSTRLVQLMEGLIAATRPSGAVLVLGDDRLDTAPGGLDRLEARLGRSDRVAAWLREVSRDQPIAGLLVRLGAIDGVGAFEAVDHEQARVLQQTDLGFVTRALLAIGLDRFAELDQAARGGLTDPLHDSDDDGVTNADEIATGSALLDPDTDDDGAPDATDPCPVDPLNGCAGVDADGDRDGVLDVFDNCIPVANRDQSDRDRNGIGDACDARFAALIAAPQVDPIYVTGQIFEPRGVFTRGVVPVRWRFDRLAADSTDIQPAPIHLLSPGRHTVTLTAEGASDSRVITVIGPDRAPLALSVRVPNTVYEGQQARLVLDGPDDLIAWDWQLGDGATAETADVRHRYAQDGLYAGRVLAADADGRIGEAEFVVTVRDTAPVPAFDVRAPGGLARRFVDRSAAFDGIAQVDWDFGDGATAAGLDVSHTYAAPGAYRVTSTVRDGDGSIARRVRELVVDAACEDRDGDGICDAVDNCPAIANATQVDVDRDGRGDACGPPACSIVERACGAARLTARDACATDRTACRAACEDAACRSECDRSRAACLDDTDADEAACLAQACLADRVCAEAADAEEVRCRVTAEANHAACARRCADAGCRTGCADRRTAERGACRAAHDVADSRCGALDACDADCVADRQACQATGDAARAACRAACDPEDGACLRACNDRHATTVRDCRATDALCVAGCFEPVPPSPPIDCEADAVIDGACDAEDNCADTPNPGQIDLDGDGRGDTCGATCDAPAATCAQTEDGARYRCKRALYDCRAGCRDAACRADCSAANGACVADAEADAQRCVAGMDCTDRSLCRASAELAHAGCVARGGPACDALRDRERARCDAGRACTQACTATRKACTAAANSARTTCRSACQDAACRLACRDAHLDTVTACYADAIGCTEACP